MKTFFNSAICGETGDGVLRRFRKQEDIEIPHIQEEEEEERQRKINNNNSNSSNNTTNNKTLTKVKKKVPKSLMRRMLKKRRISVANASFGNKRRKRGLKDR